MPYKQRVEEISPSLRYCAYNIGDEKAVDLLELRSQGVLENFDTLVSQTQEKTEDVLYEVIIKIIYVNFTFQNTKKLLNYSEIHFMNNFKGVK